MLNTAARLLDLCKQRDEALMAQQAVGETMIGVDGIEPVWSGEAHLRGKRLQVQACSLQCAPVA